MFPVLQRTPSQATYHAVALEEFEGLLNRSRLLKDQAMTLHEEQRHLVSILQRQLQNVQLARCDETDRADLLAIGNAALELLSAIHILIDEDAGMDTSQKEAKNNLSEKLNELTNDFETIKLSYDIEKMDQFILRLQTYVNAASPEPTGPIDERFQSLILGCNRDTQRFFRRRIQEFYHQCVNVQQEYQLLSIEELTRRRQSVQNVRSSHTNKGNPKGSTTKSDDDSSNEEDVPQPRPTSTNKPSLRTTAQPSSTRATGTKSTVTNTTNDNNSNSPTVGSTPKSTTTTKHYTYPTNNNNRRNRTTSSSNTYTNPPDLWESIPSSFRGLWDTASSTFNNYNGTKDSDNVVDEDNEDEEEEGNGTTPTYATSSRYSRPSSQSTTNQPLRPPSSSSSSHTPYLDPLTSILFGTTKNTSDDQPSASRSYPKKNSSSKQHNAQNTHYPSYPPQPPSRPSPHSRPSMYSRPDDDNIPTVDSRPPSTTGSGRNSIRSHPPHPHHHSSNPSSSFTTGTHNNPTRRTVPSTTTDPYRNLFSTGGNWW